jgi:hypothetical protein
MTRVGLIRLGGLATMVGGILYALQTFWLRPLLIRMSDTESNLWAFYILIVSFLALLALGVMAIVALDSQRVGRYGLIAALASLTVGVGAAMILVGMGMSIDVFGSNLPLLFLIVGALVATFGLVVLGIVTIAAGVLPWWCGAALIASPILAVISGPPGGLLLVLVGYVVYRAGVRQTQEPLRLRVKE